MVMKMLSKYLSLRLVVLAVGLIAVLWFVYQRPATAAVPEAPTLVIEPIQEVHAGDTAMLSMELLVPSGRATVPVAGQKLRVYVNGTRFRDLTTDSNGMASAALHENTAGTYKVDVVVMGADRWLPTVTRTQFLVKPAALDIQVVPPMPGIQVKADGAIYTSDAVGIIHIERDSVTGTELQLVSKVVDAAGTRASFSRWLDDEFAPDRPITISSRSQLQIGFDVSNYVTLGFVDPDANPVELTRISGITIRSSTGTNLKLSNYGPQWLESSHIVRRQTTLESTPIEWGVDNVTIDGSNVVNQGQQHFLPKPFAQWNVRLLLFSAQFTAKDALFGYPIGSGFKLTYPDGSVHFVVSNGKAGAKQTSLVRGNYEVQVKGAPGFAAVSPVDLSRTQSVQLLVLSYADAAIVMGLVSLVGLWLLFIGRPAILYAVGIRWPANPSRQPFIRTGVALVALATALLVSFDAYHRADNIPFLPDTNNTAASQRISSTATPQAPSSPSDGAAVDQATPEATATPTPAPQIESIAATQYIVGPEFAPFWEANGGLSAFGYPINNEVSAGGQDGVVVQQFERQLMVFDPANEGTPYAIQLSLAGTEYATRHDLLTTPPFQPVGSPPDDTASNASTTCFYFVATEHSVCGGFLQYWQQHGLDFGDKGTSFRESLALLGYPISEPFVDPDTGLTVQYFERARLEYHPANSDPNKVLLGRLEVAVP